MKSTKPKIKVLFRLRSLEMGGVPRVIFDLLENLPKDKFDFTLMLNLYQGELTQEIPNGIKVIVIEKGKEYMSKNPFIQKIQLLLRRVKLEIYDWFPSLLYAIKVPDKYDIEIASSYTEFDMVLNSPLKDSRKIAWFHTDVSYDKDENRVKNRIDKMKKFDHVVFCAAHIRNVIEDLYHVTYPNSSVVYNAIHVEDVKAKSEEINVNYHDLQYPVFCSVGRLHRRKGYDALIRVHQKLIKEGLMHSIVVLGDGEERDNLLTQIKACQVETTFKLLGTKVNPYPYIKNADYFVLPTRSEAYPLVINEALALEKVIISTNVGGIPEMIDDGKDGILVNPNEEDIYEGIKRMLQDPAWVEMIKLNTKQAYHKFDADKIYQQVTSIFEHQYQLKIANVRK